MEANGLKNLVKYTLPFGKCQGRLIADLPSDCPSWFPPEGYPKDEIGRQIALMQEIDHNGLSELLTPLRQTHPEGHP